LALLLKIAETIIYLVTMKKILSSLILFFILTTVFSQDDGLVVAPSEDKIFTEDVKAFPDPVVTIDIDIRAAFTTGEFKQFYPKSGMGGFGIDVLVPLGKTNPLDVGAGFGYYFMSRSEETYGYYTPGVGDYDVNSKVSGGMFSFHTIARLYPLKSVRFPIQPYIEGLAGFRLFSANQRLETYIHVTDTYLPVEKDYNYNGSWSYGFGGGFKIMMSKSELLFLNLKASKIYGTATKNMDPSSVQLYDDGTYEYSEFKSRTDVLRFSLGIHIMIE
jgi:hypothetical protein